MEIPSWFQSAIQDRLDEVTARIQFNPNTSKYRAEEKRAFEALFSCDVSESNQKFMDWEDKRSYRCALDNELLYLQGMRDGAKLVVALMSDSTSHVTSQCSDVRGDLK